FSSLLTPPPTTTLFPYTTLFRSPELFGRLGDGQFRELGEVGARRDRITGEHPVPDRSAACPGRTADGGGGDRERTVGDSRVEVRSEEHTSELQSRFDLVCRLLLE